MDKVEQIQAEIQELKEIIEDAKLKQSNLAGRKELLLNTLKEQFGVKSIKEARAKIKKLEAKREKLLGEIDGMLAELDEMQQKVEYNE